MKIGDCIRLSETAVRVYGLGSDTGLIVDRVPQKTYSASEGYPDDYRVLINGKVELMGFGIEKTCEVLNENR